MVKNSSAKQQGLSMIGWLVVLAVAGILLLAAFRLAPLYIDNSFVKASLNSLEKENAIELTSGGIRRKVSNYFTINNVRDVSAKDIKITREKGRLIVTLDYERRVNFIANIDFVVVFNNMYDSAAVK